MKRLRILFAPLGHFLSHFTRCMSVADALKRREHEIGFMSAPKDEVWLAQYGYKSFPAYSMPPTDIIAYGAPFAYQERFLGEHFADIVTRQFNTAQLAESDNSIYAQFKPDLVIWDGRPTTPITASLKGLRVIGINNLSMPIDNQLTCDASPEAEKRTTLEIQIQKELQEYFSPMIAGTPHCQRNIRAIPWIVPGIPAFENKSKLALLGNPNHHYVGSLHWAGWDNLPKPAPQHYGSKPVILVTFGSTFPFPNIAKQMIRAFPADRYHLIINTGEQFKIAPDELRGHEVMPLICLRSYLEISDVVVHHGGHGTSIEALKAGRPSVVIPFNGDQIDIAKRLDQFGCARVTHRYPDDVSADDLVNDIEAVLTDKSYAENAHRFKQEFDHWPNGAEMAADWIERHCWQM